MGRKNDRKVLRSDFRYFPFHVRLEAFGKLGEEGCTQSIVACRKVASEMHCNHLLAQSYLQA